MIGRKREKRVVTTREESQRTALIVGAGIAGIQAALDIADAGFKVVLVEREPCIGGRMSQLDKTFPTLDCSSCILTPRMVDAGRHPNIELLTYSEVEWVKQEDGRFRVRVRKKARSVDEDKCTGCGDCVQACIVRNDAYLEGPLQALEETLKESLEEAEE